MFLLEKGIEMCEEEINKCIYHCIDEGHSEMVDFLVKRWGYSEDLLIEALNIGSEEIVCILLRYEKNMNKYIIESAEKRMSLVVSELLNRGASANQNNEYGNTPLHIACKNNDINTIRVILKFNPLIITNNRNQTPLQIALLNKNIEIIQEIKNYMKNSSKL